MPKLNLKPGQQFNYWTLVAEAPKKGNVRYWHCRCICGTEKTIRQSSLTTGNSKSCGCKATPKKANDLTGKRYGRLTVIKKLDHKIDDRIAWRCKCDCGNYTDVKGVYLTTGETKSCGCLKHDQDEVNLRNMYDANYVDDVNVSLLKSKLRSDNKSGIKGVYYSKSKKSWNAYIGYGGKRKYLGSFKSKSAAIKARKQAEEKYHKPYLEEFNMKKVNFNIRIEEELREQFKKVAEENVQNPSALVRRWISDYVEKHKKD